MNKLQQFIEDNSLSLDGTGSELNSTLCTIAGYALHINGDKPNCIDEIKILEEMAVTEDVIEEFERVYDFAWRKDYANWWKDEHAHSVYTFE